MPVTNVAESQNIDAAGNVTDVYELTYTLPNHPGAYTISVPKNDNAVAAATAEIAKLTEQVDALYGIS